MKAADFNSDAGVVTFRQGKNQTSDVVPRPTSHPRLDARNARGADRSHSRAIGHTDTRMTEKHYAHLAPRYVADTIRAHFPMLGITGDAIVTPIRSNRG
jgi:hypothetical protein